MAPLADLPAELLSRIASYLFSLDPGVHDKFVDDGFCNLRLTSSQLECRTRYTFERAAFATRVVSLQAESLSRLRGISNNPRLGKLINKLVFVKAAHPVFDDDSIPLRYGVTFGLHTYAGYGVIELPKQGTDGVYLNDGWTLRKRVHHGLQSCLGSIISHTPNLKEMVIQPSFLASFWLDSPSRQEQLNEQAQRNHRLIVPREMVGYDSDLIADAENEDYDDNSIDEFDRIEAYVYPDYLLYLATQAAQRSGVQLSSLSSMSPQSSSTRARTFVEIAPVFRGLQHLTISFKASDAKKLRRMDGSALHNDSDGRPVATSLGLALNSLRDLRSLKLAFDDYYWEEDRHTNIANSLRGLGDQPFERLTSIEIRDAAFVDDDLYEFVQQQRSTLRRLHFTNVALLTQEHWRPVLTLMRDDMPLLQSAACMNCSGGPHFLDPALDCSYLRVSIHETQRQDALVSLGAVLEHLP